MCSDYEGYGLKKCGITRSDYITCLEESPATLTDVTVCQMLEDQ